MALKSNALVALEPTKAYVKEFSASNDSLIEDFINECSSLIERYCNRKFREDTYIELYDGARTNEIMLTQWPVNQIVSIHEDANRVFGPDTLLDASTYFLRSDEMQEDFMIYRTDQIFARGKATVRIEYRAGYAAYTDVPADLQLACKRTVGYYFKQQQNKDLTETNISKGDENITLIDGLPNAVKVLLDPHKRFEILAPPSPVRNY